MNQNQYLSDKIKAARQSDDGQGWLTFNGKRYHIVTSEEAVDALEDNTQAFVKSKCGIELRWVHRHDGNRIRYTMGGCRYLNDEDVMAVVLEEHERQ